MLLDATEGILSLEGAQAPVVDSTPSLGVGDQTSVTNAGGASALFWLICLGTGLGVGILAYVLVLKLGG